MKTVIMGGFLGSGKTTCILSLAKYLAGKEASVVILENEIGEVGVDDAFLRSTGMTVREIFAGCICCTAAGELTGAADLVKKDINPDWLIIETTGVAAPDLIRENLFHALGINARVFSVMDASRWRKIVFAMETLLESQISGSDVVLLNKSELVSEDDLLSAETDITDFGAKKIIRVSAESGIDDNIWRLLLGGEENE